MVMPSAPWPSAPVYDGFSGAPIWRGSRPSAPAMTSSSSALLATVSVMGPAWSTVISMGITPE